MTDQEAIRLMARVAFGSKWTRCPTARPRCRGDVNHPLGRLGRPEELGGGFVFLCSESDSFVTCSELNIDGGLTAIRSSGQIACVDRKVITARQEMACGTKARKVRTSCVNDGPHSNRPKRFSRIRRSA